MSEILEKIKSLGLELPEPIKPIASYVPALRVGDIIYTSGHLPIKNGEIIYQGEIGGIYSTIEQGFEAAQLCVMNALSSINALTGNLDNIKQIVKLTGYVKSAKMFYDQPKVINGASNLLIDIFGQEKGQHVRTAIGVNELPLNSSVELDLVVLLNT